MGSCCIVGWSDFALFSLDFRIWPHCCRLDIFLEVHCQKNCIFCRARRGSAAKFSHKKITGALKIFFFNLQILLFYFKEQAPKGTFRIQLCLTFFKAPKLAKIGFAQSEGKTIFLFLFNFCLLYNQTKDQILPQAQK